MIKSLNELAFVFKRNTSAKELKEICKELGEAGHLHDSKYYRRLVEIKQPKKPGGKIKERILYPSSGRLREIQDGIKDNILSKISMPEFVQGGVKGKSNITNALVHKGKRYKFTTDLKKFFPSVTSGMVYNILRGYGFSGDVSRVLTILCTYKGMLPQGIPTSTHLANMVFLPVDYTLQKACPIPDITYTRFVDDITISSSSDLKPYTSAFIKVITDASFRISHQKTHYNGVADITGIKVRNNYIMPDKKFLDKLNDPNQTEKQKMGRLIYLNRILEADKGRK
ncbi:MAG TPA: reverse transcriptase family protein [Puia sp.]|nr:reverse transcriptase family protein [Puia sp.]